MAKAPIETTLETPETTAMSATAEQDTGWLRTLEEKVHTAADRIRALREENALLRQRVQDLEERLAAPQDSGAADRWVEERQEIRGRVERLVEHLEGLLE